MTFMSGLAIFTTQRNAAWGCYFVKASSYTGQSQSGKVGRSRAPLPPRSIDRGSSPVRRETRRGAQRISRAISPRI